MKRKRGPKMGIRRKIVLIIKSNIKIYHPRLPPFNQTTSHSHRLLRINQKIKTLQ